MTVLIATERFNLKGKVVEPGQKIRTNRPEVYIQRGFARAMTTDETRAMLDEFVAEARRLFSRRREYPRANKEIAAWRGSMRMAPPVSPMSKTSSQQRELYES